MDTNEAITDSIAELDRLQDALRARRDAWCGPPPAAGFELAERVHHVMCGRCPKCEQADRALQDRGVDVATWREQLREIVIRHRLDVACGQAASMHGTQ